MRVLVVEDDLVLQDCLETLLKEEDYAVDVASDGGEGLALARENDYDAIVLDVLLPQLDGWEFLARLRPERVMPVLMLTACDTPREKIRGLDLGADDYLAKPFDADELLARLRALIRRSMGHPVSIIALGAIAINISTKRVTKDGAEVQLTAKEYRLLEYLALNRTVLVSRTQLYDHLFDEKDNTFSNLLDVYVSNLRRKLGTDVITTRRGLGYCIE